MGQRIGMGPFSGASALALSLLAVSALAACSSDSDSANPTSDGGATGGSTSGSGGTGAAGANSAGANSAGNHPNSGGASNGGAASGTGGVNNAGGSKDAGAGGMSNGGSSGSGGSIGSGGAPNTPAFTCATSTPGPVTPTYFVDFDAGSDSADGKSAQTPWKHSPGDSSATGVAASTSLASGDVVVFKGGVRYKGSIDVPASGTAAARIVFDGNSTGTWGTGLAVIDGEETRSHGFRLQNRAYVTIDSFAIESFDKATSSTAVSVDGGSNDEVSNCRIRDVYYPTNPGGTSWEKQSGTGIAVNNSPGTRVHHNTVRDVGGSGISFSAGSGNVVDGGDISCNEVTNMNWGINVALGNSTPGTKITNVTVLGNYIHDFDQYYVSNAWHRDGIFVFARPDSDQTSVENLEIAYNYFEDNTSDYGSTAWLYFEYVCKNFNVHHNVLNASRSYYAVRVMGDGFQVEGNHVFSNNVIDNMNGIGDGMHLQESSGIKLYDNIFYDDGNAYIVATSSMSGFDADYNLIYRKGGTGQVVSLNAGPAENPGGDRYDLAGLKAATTFEQHGIFADPDFSVDPATIDSDPTGFIPKATSQAIDHGSDRGYTSDFLGNGVPKGAAPDIGAFERTP
jgi:Right handed beta helix region